MDEINGVGRDLEYKQILVGSVRSLKVVNVFAGIIGFILLYYWLNVRQSGGLIAFSIGYAVLFLYLVLDTIYWIHNGIHEVRIAENFFVVIRGRKNKETRINANQITDIQYSNQMSRRSLQILLGRKIVRIEGIYTFYPGPKVWLTSDAFDDLEFDNACDLIETMFAESKKEPEN